MSFYAREAQCVQSPDQVHKPVTQVCKLKLSLKILQNLDLMDHPNGIFGIRGYVWGCLTISNQKTHTQNFKWPNFCRIPHYHVSIRPKILGNCHFLVRAPTRKLIFPRTLLRIVSKGLAAAVAWDAFGVFDACCGLGLRVCGCLCGDNPMYFSWVGLK